jgi:hypothetical protein
VGDGFDLAPMTMLTMTPLRMQTKAGRSDTDKACRKSSPCRSAVCGLSVGVRGGGLGVGLGQDAARRTRCVGIGESRSRFTLWGIEPGTDGVAAQGSEKEGYDRDRGWRRRGRSCRQTPGRAHSCALRCPSRRHLQARSLCAGHVSADTTLVCQRPCVTLPAPGPVLSPATLSASLSLWFYAPP